MEEDNEAVYVVRKGNVVGFYKTFEDCQNQVCGSSVLHPSVGVYKGHSWSNEAEHHLDSHGLKNALYTINASDLQYDIFGKLVACPIQEPLSKKRKIFQEPDSTTLTKKRKINMDYSTKDVMYTFKRGGTGTPVSGSNVHKLDSESCVLAFHGASEGYPGKSGAGAVLRAEDGTAVIKLREGLGLATKSYADYRALILGLKFALKRGYKNIRVRGDSRLVCNQVQGRWNHKNKYQTYFYQVTQELMEKFVSCKIKHVLRGRNLAAYVQANHATKLKDGNVEVDMTIFSRRFEYCLPSCD